MPIGYPYYHALYNLIALCAAFLATLVLLFSIGVVISVSPALRNRWYLGCAVTAGAVGSWFFLWRIHTFGQFVNAQLGDIAKSTQWVPEPWNLLIGATIVLVVTVLDFIVLSKASKT
jgi:hypothetical protein